MQRLGVRPFQRGGTVQRNPCAHRRPAGRQQRQVPPRPGRSEQVIRGAAAEDPPLG